MPSLDLGVMQYESQRPNEDNVPRSHESKKESHRYSSLVLDSDFEKDHIEGIGEGGSEGQRVAQEGGGGEGGRRSFWRVRAGSSEDLVVPLGDDNDSHDGENDADHLARGEAFHPGAGADSKREESRHGGEDRRATHARVAQRGVHGPIRAEPALVSDDSLHGRSRERTKDRKRPRRGTRSAVS